MSYTPADIGENRPNWPLRIIGILGLLFCGCTLLTVICGGGVTAVLYGAMTQSEPYQYALETAQANPAVRQALGTPIEAGWFPQGEANTSGAGGSVNLSISISGPNGSGTLYVEGVRRNEKWDYSVLEVYVDGRSEPIPLER